MKARTYKGHRIFRCQQLNMGNCDGTGWHVQTYHSPTGIPWSEQECPHYRTLEDARADIRVWVEEDRQYASLVLARGT